MYSYNCNIRIFNAHFELKCCSALVAKPYVDHHQSGSHTNHIHMYATPLVVHVRRTVVYS